MQVAQISASAAVSVTDTKIQLFLYESKLNRWQCAFNKNHWCPLKLINL